MTELFCLRGKEAKWTNCCKQDLTELTKKRVKKLDVWIDLYFHGDEVLEVELQMA